MNQAKHSVYGNERLHKQRISHESWLCVKKEMFSNNTLTRILKWLQFIPQKAVYVRWKHKFVTCKTLDLRIFPTQYVQYLQEFSEALKNVKHLLKISCRVAMPIKARLLDNSMRLVLVKTCKFYSHIAHSKKPKLTKLYLFFLY